jgi:hypothetical protein
MPVPRALHAAHAASGDVRCAPHACARASLRGFLAWRGAPRAQACTTKLNGPLRQPVGNLQQCVADTRAGTLANWGFMASAPPTARHARCTAFSQQEESMRDLHWYEIAIYVFAAAVLVPMLAIAILPFGLLGMPVFLSLIGSVRTIAADS